MLQTLLATPISASDHIRGALNAPLSLVEYGDYECPYCALAYPIVKELHARFGDELCIVFRNFPLWQEHPNAVRAAEAAEDAGLQGQFWPMHDRLFEHQDQLQESDLKSHAGALGLDAAQFAHDLANETCQERLRADIASGEASGVSGTPMFYINGVRFEGNWQGHGLLGALERQREKSPSVA